MRFPSTDIIFTGTQTQESLFGSVTFVSLVSSPKQTMLVSSIHLCGWFKVDLDVSKHKLHTHHSHQTHSFSRYSPSTLTHFCHHHSKAMMLIAQNKQADCVANSGHKACIHHLFWLSVLSGDYSLAQTSDNHYGLNLDCKEGGLKFPSPRLPLSNSPCADMDCHVAGWFPLAVSKAFSCELLCIHCYEASYCNTEHKCCTMWQRICRDHPFCTQKILATILPTESCTLNFLDSRDLSWCHSILDLFDFGVKWYTYVSPQITTCYSNSFPSCSNQYRCSKDTETSCTFWLNVSIFGTHPAHTSLNSVTHHGHTFLNSTCSWIIVSTLQTHTHTHWMHCNSYVLKLPPWHYECSRLLTAIHVLS